MSAAHVPMGLRMTGTNGNLRAVPQLGRGARWVLVLGFALLATMLLVTAANAVFGLGGAAAEKPIRDWLSSAVYILVAVLVALRAIKVEHKRVSWAIFAVGLSLYGLGNVLWSLWVEHLSAPPIPSICDVLWLSFYPLSYAGIVGFASSKGQRKPPAGVWLDGLVAGAGLASIGAAAIFHQLLVSTTGSTAAVATELAYPIGDLLLAALVVGAMTLRGWRLTRVWLLLGSSFLTLAVADCLYAVQVAAGSSAPSPMTNLLYVAAVAVLAAAAWQGGEERTGPRVGGLSVLLIPAGFTTTALGLLLYDHVHRLNPLAFGLAVVTLVAAMVRMVFAFRDIQGLAEARREASTDPLTSLPNRRLLMSRIEAAIATAQANGGRLAVMMLDLDNFKQLNDTLGHGAGDALLRQIGPRLRLALRDSDTVARLGGDEFAVLLTPAPSEDGIVHVAEKIRRALSEPFEVQGLALRLTGSVGIAAYPDHAVDVDDLLRRADIAMYQAKASRRGYEFYARERDTNSRERLALAAQLALAIESGAIEVYFQPKADARTRQIEGVEALVRWRRDDGRIMAPSDFVTAAEHAGLSRLLTRCVVGLALDQLQDWREQGLDLHVAVNTTVADLLDVEFPDEVAAALAARGLAPETLVLEVTETSVLADPARIGNVLAALSERGIGLSLDDFGTGYSSLAHLKSLPVGEVKVDRSFVSRMCTDDTDAAIVYATIQLAGKLGIRVVAEGVEDEATWEALRDCDCDLIQGFLLSRPLSATELEPVLRRAAVRATPA
jgi:diguanylate cyclase (GGDEF)-like protein